MNDHPTHGAPLDPFRAPGARPEAQVPCEVFWAVDTAPYYSRTDRPRATLNIASDGVHLHAGHLGSFSLAHAAAALGRWDSGGMFRGLQFDGSVLCIQEGGRRLLLGGLDHVASNYTLPPSPVVDAYLDPGDFERVCVLFRVVASISPPFEAPLLPYDFDRTPSTWSMAQAVVLLPTSLLVWALVTLYLPDAPVIVMAAAIAIQLVLGVGWIIWERGKRPGPPERRPPITLVLQHEGVTVLDEHRTVLTRATWRDVAIEKLSLRGKSWLELPSVVLRLSMPGVPPITFCTKDTRQRWAISVPALPISPPYEISARAWPALRQFLALPIYVAPAGRAMPAWARSVALRHPPAAAGGGSLLVPPRGRKGIDARAILSLGTALYLAALSLLIERPLLEAGLQTEPTAVDIASLVDHRSQNVHYATLTHARALTSLVHITRNQKGPVWAELPLVPANWQQGQPVAVIMRLRYVGEIVPGDRTTFEGMLEHVTRRTYASDFGHDVDLAEDIMLLDEGATPGDDRALATALALLNIVIDCLLFFGWLSSPHRRKAPALGMASLGSLR